MRPLRLGRKVALLPLVALACLPGCLDATAPAVHVGLCVPRSTTQEGTIELGPGHYNASGQLGSAQSRDFIWTYGAKVPLRLEATATWETPPGGESELQLRLADEHWNHPIVITRGASPLTVDLILETPPERSILRAMVEPSPPLGVTVIRDTHEVHLVIQQTLPC